MTEVKKEGKSQGSKNRTKGHILERRVASKFRELGYTFAKTSRQASRLLDDSKVDIAFVPFNVQCKKGYAKGLNYTNIFLETKEALKKNFPPTDLVHNNPCVVLHDKGRKNEEKLVVMEEESFWQIVKDLNKNDE